MTLAVPRVMISLLLVSHHFGKWLQTGENSLGSFIVGPLEKVTEAPFLLFLEHNVACLAGA